MYKVLEPNARCVTTEADVRGRTWVLILLWPLIFCDPGQDDFEPSSSPLIFFFFYFFNFKTLDSTVCLTEVSSLEGIYPVEDMRPTIISQLENQRSAQRPLTGEKKLRRPLKSKSDLRR